MKLAILNVRSWTQGQKLIAAAGAVLLSGSLMGASLSADYLPAHSALMGDSKSQMAMTQSYGIVQPMAAAGCSYRNAVFVTTSYVQSVDGCSIIGLDRYASWRYDWYQDKLLWNSGPSCVQGRGYYTGTSLPRWYNAGCGSSGYATVHIGNVATVAKIRGYTMALSKIGYVRWR